MTIEEMKRLKKERGYTNEYICDGSGVPLGTVQKIFSGETKSPRYDTMQALEKFFSAEPAAVYPGPVYDYPPKGERVLVKESSLVDTYSAIPQGRHTAEDYYELREHERIELIDGVIYNLASPTTKHQYVIMALTVELELYIRAHGRDCIPFPAPVSVHIDRDEDTIVEPDVCVLCDRGLLVDEKIWGAPDLVVEVLSPSTRRKDLTIKNQKYAEAGVREYWIVDLKNQKVIVYVFDHDDLISVYTFRDRIPVGIWDGECQIDFARIDDRMRQIYDEEDQTK